MTRPRPEPQGRPAIYVIGSMRNARVPEIAKRLRERNYDVFDDWYSPGEQTDDKWKEYEKARGRSYREALEGHHARNVFEFDEFHLNRAHAAVLVLPAGRSGHIEAGVTSVTKPVFVLQDAEGDPERLDVMTQFLHGVYPHTKALEEALAVYPWPKLPAMPFFTIGDVQWLSGVFEGDGTFCVTEKRSGSQVPRMVLQMTDEDVVQRAASIMGSSVWNTSTTKTGKQVYACGAAGLSAAEWMRVIRPYMGRRRQRQIVQSVQTWLDGRKYNTRDRAWWLRVFQLEKP